MSLTGLYEWKNRIASSILRILDATLWPWGGRNANQDPVKVTQQPHIPQQPRPKCSYLTISKLITRHQMVLPTVKGDARSLRQTAGWQKERSSEVSEGRWETCPSIHTTSRGTAQTRDQGLVTRNAWRLAVSSTCPRVTSNAHLVYSWSTMFTDPCVRERDAGPALKYTYREEKQRNKVNAARQPVCQDTLRAGVGMATPQEAAAKCFSQYEAPAEVRGCRV